MSNVMSSDEQEEKAVTASQVGLRLFLGVADVASTFKYPYRWSCATRDETVLGFWLSQAQSIRLRVKLESYTIANL